MPEPTDDLGMTLKLSADAVGEPGQRRFRLLVEAQGGSACLWMEKDQLLQLALSIKGLQEGKERPYDSAGRPSAMASGDQPGVEFQVWKLALREVAGGRLWTLMAYDENSAEGDTPTLSLEASLDQFNALSDEALEVCAAGRPLCPLCAVPMNAGEEHKCSRTNGRATL